MISKPLNEEEKQNADCLTKEMTIALKALEAELCELTQKLVALIEKENQYLTEQLRIEKSHLALEMKERSSLEISLAKNMEEKDYLNWKLNKLSYRIQIISIKKIEKFDNLSENEAKKVLDDLNKLENELCLKVWQLDKKLSQSTKKINQLEEQLIFARKLSPSPLVKESLSKFNFLIDPSEGESQNSVEKCLTM